MGEQSPDPVDGSLLEPPCDERPLDQSIDEVLGELGAGSKGRSERSNQPVVFQEKVDISFSDNGPELPEEPH
jgi:hypothetical protein